MLKGPKSSEKSQEFADECLKYIRPRFGQRVVRECQDNVEQKAEELGAVLAPEDPAQMSSTIMQEDKRAKGQRP